MNDLLLEFMLQKAEMWVGTKFDEGMKNAVRGYYRTLNRDLFVPREMLLAVAERNINNLLRLQSDPKLSEEDDLYKDLINRVSSGVYRETVALPNLGVRKQMKDFGSKESLQLLDYAVPGYRAAVKRYHESKPLKQRRGLREYYDFVKKYDKGDKSKSPIKKILQ